MIAALRRFQAEPQTDRARHPLCAGHVFGPGVEYFPRRLGPAKTRHIGDDLAHLGFGVQAVGDHQAKAIRRRLPGPEQRHTHLVYHGMPDLVIQCEPQVAQHEIRRGGRGGHQAQKQGSRSDHTTIRPHFAPSNKPQAGISAQ